MSATFSYLDQPKESREGNYFLFYKLVVKYEASAFPKNSWKIIGFVYKKPEGERVPS